ncbi:hypothetical protein JW890_02460 [candidate division WOR-3 bacterium]|nr:hypothetical protein [candidate division WOR-3 bacterium]
MWKIIVIIGLLAPSCFYAVSDGPSGWDYTVIFSDSSGAIPEFHLNGDIMNNAITQESEKELIEAQNSENPIPYAPLWGPDILVTDECIMTPRYDIGFDYDSDKFLYVALLSSNSVNDTIKVYRSTDRGIHWDEIFTLNFNSLTPVCFKDFDFRVSHNDADPDMIFAWVDSCLTSHNNRFWFGKINVNTLIPYYYLFDTSSTATRNVKKISMDINELPDPYVVITYTKGVPNFWMSVQTTNTGATWNIYQHTTGDNLMYPYCTFSDDNNFNVAIVNGSNNSVLMRNGAISGPFSYLWLNDTSDHTIRTQLKISAEKLVIYPNNTIIAVWRQGIGSVSRIYQNISTNGGQSWSGEAINPMAGDIYTGNPYVRFGQNRSALFTFLDFQFAQDSLCACVYSVYSGWEGKTYINDYAPSGLLPAVGSYVSDGGINGRVVAYRQYAANSIWFDRWNYTTQVEEQPTEETHGNLFSCCYNNEGYVLLNISLERTTMLSITVYDVISRKVISLADGEYSAGSHSLTWNHKDSYGQNVTDGRYFVNFKIDASSITKIINLL